MYQLRCVVRVPKDSNVKVGSKWHVMVPLGVTETHPLVVSVPLDTFALMVSVVYAQWAAIHR